MKSVKFASLVFVCSVIQVHKCIADNCNGRGNLCGRYYGVCCEGLMCTNLGFCSPYPLPPCQTLLQACSSDESCCFGLSCQDGLCKTSWSTVRPCVPQAYKCGRSYGDCCDDLVCTDEGYCSRYPIPTCQTLLQACDFDEHCCFGLSCHDDGLCKVGPSSVKPCLHQASNCYNETDGCCSGLTCDATTWQCRTDVPTTTSDPPTKRSTAPISSSTRSSSHTTPSRAPTSSSSHTYPTDPPTQGPFPFIFPFPFPFTFNPGSPTHQTSPFPPTKGTNPFTAPTDPPATISDLPIIFEESSNYLHLSYYTLLFFGVVLVLFFLYSLFDKRVEPNH